MISEGASGGGIRSALGPLFREIAYSETPKFSAAAAGPRREAAYALSIVTGRVTVSLIVSPLKTRSRKT